MIRPGSNDLRHASQISVVRQDVENMMSQMIAEGRPLSATAEARYYFLGLTGSESQERITEDSFYGRDDENPRQPGYYAVEIVSLHDGKNCTAKPFYAVFRDQSQQVGQQRERPQEAHWSDLMEEGRLLNAGTKRELQDQVRKNHQLQTELDTFVNAYNALRKEKLAFEIERDKAIHDAEHMEHERNMAVERCNELEAEAASFKPQIEQMVDGFTAKVAPHVQQVFMAMGGSAFGLDDEGGAGAGATKKPKPSPWSGGGGVGSSSSEDASSDATASGATSGSPGVGGAGGGRQTPMSNDPEMPTPEVLAHTLYQLFWESESFGRHMHCKQKDETGNPYVPWWLIRGVVFYDQGIDLGPVAIWPSECRENQVDARAEPQVRRQGKSQSKTQDSRGSAVHGSHRGGDVVESSSDDRESDREDDARVSDRRGGATVVESVSEDVDTGGYEVPIDDSAGDEAHADDSSGQSDGVVDARLSREDDGSDGDDEPEGA